jgi:hypothetical protein
MKGEIEHQVGNPAIDLITATEILLNKPSLVPLLITILLQSYWRSKVI